MSKKFYYGFYNPNFKFSVVEVCNKLYCTVLVSVQLIEINLISFHDYNQMSLKQDLEKHFNNKKAEKTKNTNLRYKPKVLVSKIVKFNLPR